MLPCYKNSLKNATWQGGLALALFFVLFLAQPAVLKAQTPRFFLMGDGILSVAGQKITFRTGADQYDPEGLRRLNQLFRAPWSEPQERLSLRFIEVLDYLQDQLGGRNYTVRSGYRSPRHNQGLRKRGKLAAQSSMHIESAAGDLILSGVPSGEIFTFVKGLDCCGIGWYHSRHFHLDTGPSRYWDEKTSKTEDKTPQENAKVILQADYDRYRPGETVALKLMRITQYPIGLTPKLILKSASEPIQTAVELPVEFSSNQPDKESCLLIKGRATARGLQVKLPAKKVPAGRYTLQADFCNRFDYEKMPTTIDSRVFEITS